jgi:hypothetical protein
MKSLRLAVLFASVLVVACSEPSASAGDGGAMDAGPDARRAGDGGGAACTLDADCASGSCVDGTCCDRACDGACEGCSSGTCAPYAAGTDPDDECDAADATTCGRSGSCDGAGACALHAEGTVCAPVSCAAGVQTQARTCDGDGVCTDRGTIDCAPLGCSGDRCAGSCADDLACADGEFCDTGLCVPALAQGLTCLRDRQCASARCAEGVCCDRACASRCEACAASVRGAGVDGTCGPIVAGTDPDDECAATSAAECGNDGACDGAGSCREWAASTVCTDATCVSGVATTAGLCSGTGSCGPSTATPCTPYACGATACRTSCAGDGDCAAGARCSGGACVAALANGAACTSAVECTSGLCVDGFCCDGACTGTCQACNVVGSRGTCSIVSMPYDYDTCAPPMQCTATGACRLQQGSVCTLGTECATGLCVDGYCCNDACVGTCIACDNVGERGRCSIVHAGMDPDDECPGAATCSGLGDRCM